MLGRFKKEEKLSDENLIELDINEPVDCLCDFTYNFYWNHNGDKMELTDKIPTMIILFRILLNTLKKDILLKLTEILAIDFVQIWVLI